jgi:methanogenic corrinoid protein MtbC1
MVKADVLKRYVKALINGDRQACRKVIEETMQSGVPANSVYLHMIWPIMCEIEQLFRSDQISTTQEHLATRINRTIVDQLQNKLPRRPSREQRIIVCCAQDEIQELGAQMIADLFESDGWEVRFLGGGLTNDDILAYVNGWAPDWLIIYGTTPRQAPQVRKLIDWIKEVNAWPNLKIMVSGGLFGRAEGLWEEIGADAYGENPADALKNASEDNPTYVVQRTINRRKRKRQEKAAITETTNQKTTEAEPAAAC